MMLVSVEEVAELDRPWLDELADVELVSERFWKVKNDGDGLLASR